MTTLRLPFRGRVGGAEKEGGARRLPWTVTFADMCLLLMGFFVLQFTTAEQGRRAGVPSASLSDVTGPRIVPVIGSAPNALAGDLAGFEAFDATDPARAGLALGRALADGRVEIVKIGESLVLHFTALEDRKDEADLKRLSADALEALARLALRQDLAAAQRQAERQVD